MPTRPEISPPSERTVNDESAEPTGSLDILVVDDEPRIRDMLAKALERHDHRVRTVARADDARAASERELYDLIFLDLRLPDSSGLDLIPELTELLPEVKIVVITAHATIASAVTAMRRGAADYLPKPFSPEQVHAAVRTAEQLRALEEEVQTLRRDVEQSRPEALLEFRSSPMRELVDTARRVADTDATILLRGENGTGKGVMARAVHSWSDRSEEPFVVVHGPSLPRELFESELFGHVKGAFTGAEESRPGRISRAEGGTLFLDEIADLPSDLQPKLLRFLQDQEYERVGDPTTRRAEVRLIAATNHDLEQAVERGTFRQDLLYRLNVIELEIPPLRNRTEDLIPLARQFLDFFSEKYNRPIEGFTSDAVRKLRRYDWPGNVRELKNVVERAVILTQESEITPSMLVAETRAASDLEKLEIGQCVSLQEVEEAHIRRIVARTETLEEAAEILDIDPSTLWRRRKEYGMGSRTQS